MTTSQLIFGVISWLVGFLSAIGANWFLERCRAFRGVIGACHSIESRIADDIVFPDFHQWSIKVLEVPFFAGIGFLSAEDQKKASEAWGRYQSFDAAQYPKDDFEGRLDIAIGAADATRTDVLKREIQKIRSLFRTFPR